MRIKSLIVDDEPLARKVIRDYIEQISGIELKGECADAMDAQKVLSMHDIDVIYLDINMPLISGMDFIRIVQPLPLVVFTTAYPDYAVEAFELQAFDYLVKPISFDRFLKSFQRIQKHLGRGQISKPDERIKIKEGKRLYQLQMDEIYMVQAYGDYIKVFTPEKVYVTKQRLIKFAELLPEQFIQVHRSYIINLRSVSYLEGNFVMIEGQQIPVSQSYREKLIERL